MHVDSGEWLLLPWEEEGKARVHGKSCPREVQALSQVKCLFQQEFKVIITS